MKINLTPKKVFLIDCLGALLSAFLLGIVLVSLERLFGMPPGILYFLALLACVFALYSFWNYRNLREKWQPYLKAIAFANLFYCGLTLGLVIYFRGNLTTLGFLYFGLEILVILALVKVELTFTSRAGTSGN